MILFNKAYMKVWKVDKKDNYTVLKVSTSEKQQDGTYKSSSWFCRLVGKAHLEDIKEGDQITVLKGKIENIWDAENQKSWLNVIIFDCDVTKGKTKKDDAHDTLAINDDELPF